MEMFYAYFFLKTVSLWAVLLSVEEMFFFGLENARLTICFPMTVNRENIFCTKMRIWLLSPFPWLSIENMFLSENVRLKKSDFQ